MNEQPPQSINNGELTEEIAGNNTQSLPESPVKLLIFLSIFTLLLIGLGLYQDYPLSNNILLLPRSSFLYLIPSMLLVGLSVWVSLKALQRCQKDSKQILAFLYALSVYVILSALVIGGFIFLISIYIETLPIDVSSAVSLIARLFFLTSIYLYYIGMIVSVILSIWFIYKFTPQNVITSSVKVKIARYFVIFLALMWLLYIFGVVKPVAIKLQSQMFCKLVYGTSSRVDCLLKTKIKTKETLGISLTDLEPFTATKLPYTDINLSSIITVDDRLAFIAENKDKTSFVVYDNKVFSDTKYKKITDIYKVGNKLAYGAEEGEKEFIVYDGKEIGKEYDYAYSPILVGDKFTYEARKDEKSFIVYDGKKIGEEEGYEEAKYATDLGGKLGYIATKDAKSFLVVNGNRLGGVYDYIQAGGIFGHGLKYIDGRIVFIGNKTAKYRLIIDGVEYGISLARIDDIVFIGSEPAFFVNNNMYDISQYADGTGVVKDLLIYGKNDFVSTYISPPKNLNGELAFVMKNDSTGKYQLWVGGKPVEVEYDKISYFTTSDNGKHYTMTVGSKENEQVILDGQEVFKGIFNKPQFIGDKLLFEGIDENGYQFIYYGGLKTGEEFALHKYDCNLWITMPPVVKEKLTMVCNVVAKGTISEGTYLLVER